MNKAQKIKKFIKNNRENIFACISITAVAAFAGTLMYVGIKEQKAINAWISEQENAGNLVYQLIDGSFIAVAPNQTN